MSALLPLPARAAATHPACNDVVVSPDFGHDHTAFCLQVLGSKSTLSLYRTTTAGRSWSKAPATGLTWDSQSAFTTQVLVSPRYAADRRILIVTNTGLYVSTDTGNTFALVDPRSRPAGYDNPGLYVATAGALAPALPGSRLFTLAVGVPSARVDVATGLRQPLAPTGAELTKGFILPPATSTGQPVLAVTTRRPDESKPDISTTLWACSDDLVCAEQRATFPPETTPSTRWWWLPVARGRAGLFTITSHGDLGPSRISHDGGKTFQAWPAIDRVFKDASRYTDPPSFGIASNPALPGRLYLRVLTSQRGLSWRPGQTPAEQLFRSDNGGVNWYRVAWQRAFDQPGPRGNLPWNRAAYGRSLNDAPIALASDGRLFVPGARENESALVPGSEAVYCSLDGGRTWAATCPR